MRGFCLFLRNAWGDGDSPVSQNLLAGASAFASGYDFLRHCSGCKMTNDLLGEKLRGTDKEVPAAHGRIY